MNLLNLKTSSLHTNTLSARRIQVGISTPIGYSPQGQDSLVVYNGDNHVGITLYSEGTTGSGAINFIDTGTVYKGRILYSHDTDILRFFTNSGSPSMTIGLESGGLVTFGTTNMLQINTSTNLVGINIAPQTGHSLHVNGNTRVVGTCYAPGLASQGTEAPGNWWDSADDFVLYSGSGDAGFTIYSGSSWWGSIHFADGTVAPATYAGYIQYLQGSNYFNFGVNSAIKITLGTALLLLSASLTLEFEDTAGVKINLYSTSFYFSIEASSMVLKSTTIHDFRVGSVDMVTVSNLKVYVNHTVTGMTAIPCYHLDLGATVVKTVSANTNLYVHKPVVLFFYFARTSGDFLIWQYQNSNWVSLSNFKQWGTGIGISVTGYVWSINLNPGRYLLVFSGGTGTVTTYITGAYGATSWSYISNIVT